MTNLKKFKLKSTGGPHAHRHLSLLAATFQPDHAFAEACNVDVQVQFIEGHREIGS